MIALYDYEQDDELIYLFDDIGKMAEVMGANIGTVRNNINHALKRKDKLLMLKVDHKAVKCRVRLIRMNKKEQKR